MEYITVQRILDMYGLRAVQVYPSQKGYRNESHPVKLADGRMANVILYKSEPNVTELIKRVHDVSTFLAQAGLPVRAPIDTRTMRLTGKAHARYAGVYAYLPGETIPWEAYTQSHIKLLGQTLAELHSALTAYAGSSLPAVTDEYRIIIARMERYFSDVPVRQAMSEKLGLRVEAKVFTRLPYILSFCEKLPHQQALHMDFVRSNILFSHDHEPRVAGIIDFEKAAYGHLLFDVSRTLAFLLIDCKYKPADKVSKYFLDSGYQKRGHGRLEKIAVRGSGGQRPLLEELIDLFLLYDFYKFLRHNPYESLPQNEHFVRTRGLLLARNVITTTPES